MIQEYKFGSITIDGKNYCHDVEIRWTGEVLPWQRKESHLIEPADLERGLKENPEMIILGTGANGRLKVPEAIPQLLEEKGIKLVINLTEEAVKTFNLLDCQKEKPRIIAFLHLTC